MEIYILYYIGSYDAEKHIWGVYKTIESAKEEERELEGYGYWTEIDEQYLED